MKKMSIRKWRKMMSKELRCAVGIPSTDTWTAQFGMSLAFLVAYLSQQVPGYARQQFTVHNAKGSILPQLRHNIIKAALAAKATHVLFILILFENVVFCRSFRPPCCVFCFGVGGGGGCFWWEKKKKKKKILGGE